MRVLHESEVQSLLRKYSIRPNKERGQNFLTSLRVAQEIVQAANLSSQDRVLEIGGGLGILSDLLSKEVDQLYVIEIDAALVRVLFDRLDECQNVTILHGDALTIDLPDVTKVVANLPYSVASEITFRLMKEVPFEMAVLMYQKEFAQRLLASPESSDYSRLSIDFQYLGTAKRLMEVKAQHFYPIPKVDSSVLAVERRKEGTFAKDDEIFFWFIHGIYSYPNKQLKKALGIWFKLLKSADKVETLLQRIPEDIDVSTRLRSLRMQELVRIADAILEMILDDELIDPR